MKIKKFKEFKKLPPAFCVKTNNDDELHLVLDTFTYLNIRWFGGEVANQYIPSKYNYPIYIHYNYYENEELLTGKEALLDVISIDELKNIKKKKRRTNINDPYNEEDWGWVDDD